MPLVVLLHSHQLIECMSFVAGLKTKIAGLPSKGFALSFPVLIELPPGMSRANIVEATGTIRRMWCPPLSRPSYRSAASYHSK